MYMGQEQPQRNNKNSVYLEIKAKWYDSENVRKYAHYTRQNKFMHKTSVLLDINIKTKTK